MKKIISILACMAIAMSFAGCKKKVDVKEYVFETESMQEKPVTKVGDTEVTMEMYNFFYKAYFEQTGKEDKARELANKEIIEVYTNYEIGKKMGLEPESKDAFYKQLKGNLSGKEYDEYLYNRQVTDGFVEKLAEAQAYDEAIAKYVKENVDNNIDPDQFFRDNYLRAKHVLISTTGLDDAAKAEKKALAEDILAKAQGGEDFDALVAQYSEDPGSKTVLNGYVFPEGQMVDEFYNGTKEIAVGEYNLVESDFGFHVIKRLALDETPELYQEFFSTSAVDEQIVVQLIKDFKADKAEEFKIEVVY